MTEQLNWILRNARIADAAPLVDLALAHGQIAALGASLPSNDGQEWDLQGRVALPGLVDAHVHLDKTFVEAANQSGTLGEAITVWRRVRQNLSAESFRSRARRAIGQAVQQGTTALRTHVDVLEAPDLIALEAILQVRAETRHLVDLQIVVLGWPGESTEHTELMFTALQLGADLVGGAPALLPDPANALAAVFALAERTGKAIDLHIDETEDPNICTLELLADLTVTHGLQGQVTAGHCCSLAFMDDLTAGRIMDKVAAARLNMVTLPSCNLVLQGRQRQPAPRGITRVQELLARGVNVCVASDNVGDPFNPFGNYDLLYAANLNAHLAHMTGQQELLTSLRMVSQHAAQTLGLPAAGLVVGAPADLLVVDCTNVRDAVTILPPRLATFKRGQLIKKP